MHEGSLRGFTFELLYCTSTPTLPENHGVRVQSYMNVLSYCYSGHTRPVLECNCIDWVIIPPGGGYCGVFGHPVMHVQYVYYGFSALVLLCLDNHVVRAFLTRTARSKPTYQNRRLLRGKQNQYVWVYLFRCWSPSESGVHREVILCAQGRCDRGTLCCNFQMFPDVFST